jgi:hypothetical protein
MGFFMSVSRESNFFFKHRVDQKYFLYIHEIKPQQNLCGHIKITLKKEQSFKTFIKQGTCAQVA